MENKKTLVMLSHIWCVKTKSVSMHMYGLNTERSLICFIYVCISGAAATWSSDCTTVISRQLKPLRCTTVAAGRQRQQQQQQLCTKYKHTEFRMMIPSQTVKLPCTLNCACVLFEWSSTISSITMRYRRSVHLIHMQCIVISTNKKKKYNTQWFCVLNECEGIAHTRNTEC